MTIQTSFGTSHPKAFAGMLGDLRNKTTESFQAYSNILFGLGAVPYENDPEYQVKVPRAQGKIVFDADFVTANTIDLKVNLVSIAQVAFNTDHDTTAADLVTAISALDGVTAQLDSADANNRTFLIDVKGADTAITDVTVAGGASQAGSTVSLVYDTIFRGWNQQSHDNETNSSDVAQIVDGDMASILTEGVIWVPYAGSPAIDGTVYLQASGADAGKATSVSTNNIDTGGKFKSIDSSTGLALVGVDIV